MGDMSDPIVGIDLGTTNSVVAIVIDGQPHVLEETGEKLLPSVVGLNPQGQLVTGVPARNQLAAFPDRTVASIKRRMGRMEPVTLGDQSFTPPEISAMILRRLRDRASRALGRPVNRAVITVPAFFDENQRQATREAGALAGLTVERIINEPTAATLVYHVGSQDRKHIVVYDFGGGTFDVSIVRMEAGVIEVLTSKGDTQLGGDDLDLALMNRVADQFHAEQGMDLRTSAQARYRLLQACEQAKRRLSTEETAHITEEFIAEKAGQPLHLAATFTRKEFEELIEPFVARTISSVDAALRDVGMTVHQIDDLVLVGGSTRIPMVEERLRDEFLREPSRAVDPDLAVALGAAVQAAMLEGHSVGRVLVDVTGHTLGIEACTGISFSGPLLTFSPIIHRNSALPARYECAYQKMFDEQEHAEIHVLQGEHSEVYRNRSIGKFMLKLAPGGGDRGKIVVRFDLTLDGTLRVTATQPATGYSQELTIDNALSHFQAEDRSRAEERLGAMFAASDEYVDDDDEAGAEFGTATLEGTFRRTEAPISALPSGDVRFADALTLINKAETKRSAVGSEDARDIERVCEMLKQAIVTEDLANVASLTEELDDILFYVQ
ncbi:MAG: Hsp70 family protein [Pirellulaceae bacterium]